MKIDHFRGEYAFLSNFWEAPMDVGFERAGIKVVFANELMKEAAQTYNANHPAGVMVNDDVNTWEYLHSKAVDVFADTIFENKDPSELLTSLCRI